MTWFVFILVCAAFVSVGWLGHRRLRESNNVTEMMIANRHLPLALAWVSMAATWIGGGYINGTAEAVYHSEQGLVWCQAPWCYALSLIVGGLFFAGPMRRRNYHTMLDLFDERYGSRMAGFLYLPALVGDLFWTSAILAALGGTLGTLFGLDPAGVILVAAAVVIGYTVMGGLWSVALSDVLQFGCIALGLMIALPFVIEQCGGLQNMLAEYQAAFGDQARMFPTSAAWTAAEPWGWEWMDSALLLIFGGIPWQVYFQRVLATPSVRSAQVMSITAGVACFAVALIPIGIGMAGVVLDWEAMQVEPPPSSSDVLPYVLRHAVPTVVSLIGLSAIAAAVLSSVDSSILSSASMFTWNVFRPWAGLSSDDQRLRIVLRLGIVVLGAAAATLALQVKSVYALWYFCSDLVYVILFPQLVSALMFKFTTRFAACCGAVLSLLLRGAMFVMSFGVASESLQGLYEEVALWPWRTLIMLSSLAMILLVSMFSRKRLEVTRADG